MHSADNQRRDPDHFEGHGSPYPPRSAPPVPVADTDLIEKRAEAARELPPKEYERATLESQQEGERAGLRLTYRSVLVLAVGGLVVAAVFVDWRFALVAALLCVGFAAPFLVAGVWTRSDDAQAAKLDDAIRHKNDRRVRG
jgi:hypothetical protein